MISKFIGVGNLIKNPYYQQSLNFENVLSPKCWTKHAEVYLGLSTDSYIGDYSSKTAYTCTQNGAGSVFSCIPISKGKYTAYARFKQFDVDSQARLLMHCYDNNHSVNTGDNNIAFVQDFDISAGGWIECMFEFTAPDYTRYLHFSPRSSDDKYVLVDDCKLARGSKTLNEMRNLKSVVPIVSRLNHVYANIE